jgi:hypothetical protein
VKLHIFLTASICVAGLALSSRPAQAVTYKVDDSASETVQVTSTARWLSLSPRRGANSEVQAQAVVRVRLNVKPWLGKQARIYLVNTGGDALAFQMRWSTTGVLLPNQLLPGQRSLVYTGPVSVPQLADTLQIAVNTDGRYLAAPAALKFGFEIDVD